MKKGLWKIIFVILLCGFLPAAAVQAQWITIAISGQVTEVADWYGHLENKVHIGDTITGTYTYDSVASGSGRYEYHTPPAGILLDIGGFNFRTDPSHVSFTLIMTNNDLAGDDYYGLGSYNNLPLSNGALVDDIMWQLSDETGTALTSNTLPLTAPDLTKWGGNNFAIDSLRVSGFAISGTITSAQVIPEPVTLLLLLVGSLCLRRSKA
jgi:hypothetical protein